MTDTRILLLSSNYEPLESIGWKKAMCLLTMGKIEIVVEYGDRHIRSTSIIFKMPAVVRLVSAFRRPKKRVRYRKQNVFARDRWTCCYCGEKKSANELTVDHVVPRAQGGRTEWENVVSSCGPCNHRKADRTPKQAGMHLQVKPYRPDWVPVMIFQLKAELPEAWRPYCYQAS
jgi:5-methylcytosine-specific restriction endonuclease McrA